MMINDDATAVIDAISIIDGFITESVYGDLIIQIMMNDDDIN